MICFPNAKINIGLHVVEKREDGLHNIETIFFPIGFKDVLEILPGQDTQQMAISGIRISGNLQQNICCKAYHLLSQQIPLPPVKIHLHKAIPPGSGLGGGSSDAAYTLKTLNDIFLLQLDTSKLRQLASDLGSDCAFFIDNKPAYAVGKGDKLEHISLKLPYHIVLVIPDFQVSTKEAYSLVTPKKTTIKLKDAVKRPIKEWRDLIKNDFEFTVFQKYPELAEIKTILYNHGALYSSMSGSGSAVYGIFDRPAELSNEFSDRFLVWEGILG